MAVRMGLSPAETATTAVLLGQSAFYSMGRDNTIASLDLVNGFNSLDGTSVIGVVVQSFLTNWIGPVWWSLAGLRLLTWWHEGRRISPANTPILQNGHANGGHRTAHQNGSNGAKITKLAPKRAAKPQTAVTNGHFIELLTMQTLFSALSSLAFNLACVFIWGSEDLWGIYAPKFINAFLWVVFHQFMFNGIGCSALWFLVGN